MAIDATRFSVRIGGPELLAEHGIDGRSEDDMEFDSREVDAVSRTAIEACASRGNLYGNDAEVELQQQLFSNALDFLSPEEAMECVSDIFGKYPPPAPGEPGAGPQPPPPAIK